MMFIRFIKHLTLNQLNPCICSKTIWWQQYHQTSTTRPQSHELKLINPRWHHQVRQFMWIQISTAVTEQIAPYTNYWRTPDSLWPRRTATDLWRLRGTFQPPTMLLCVNNTVTLLGAHSQLGPSGYCRPPTDRGVYCIPVIRAQGVVTLFVLLKCLHRVAPTFRAGVLEWSRIIRTLFFVSPKYKIRKSHADKSWSQSVFV